jgi:hypothetical protein
MADNVGASFTGMTVIDTVAVYELRATEHGADEQPAGSPVSVTL